MPERVHERMSSRRTGRKRGIAALAIGLDVVPMEAKLASALPGGKGWQFEPKWDGFRCLAFRAGEEVELRAKSGKSLSRYFPEVLDFLRAVPIDEFIIDGELVILQGNVLSFEALQMRLHPAASRIRKLSQQTPSLFILFDCLMTAERNSLLAQPLSSRRAALEQLYAGFENLRSLRLCPYTRERSEAQCWLNRGGGSLDGVIAKRVEGPYLSGERAMLKVKRMRTADCVVGGFRYAANGRQVGSLLLGLYNDDGKLDHVGFTSAIAQTDRAILTNKLEALIGGPGFSGKAPGGPSRWSNERSTEWQPLKTRLVVEVSYDHVSGNRFRHGTRILRWRPDKAPEQCTYEQLQSEARPSRLVKEMIDAASCGRSSTGSSTSTTSLSMCSRGRARCGQR